MLDVAQNTARLNVLINAYYSAEYELETKTESKLQLTQSSSQQTINNQKDTMALRHEFEKLEDSMANGNSNIPVAGVNVSKLGSKDGTYPTTEAFLTQAWEKAEGNKKPGKDDSKYDVNKNLDAFGLKLDQVKNKYSSKLTTDARMSVGAEPSQSDYMKESGEVDEQGNPVMVEDTAAFNSAMNDYNTKLNNKIDELANKLQKDLVAGKQQELDEQYKTDLSGWESRRQLAGSMFEAATAKADGDTKAFTRKKQDAEDMQKIQFDQDQHDLSVQESMLDQQIQKLQAEVTALKTEIDSLKQERNSNVQSDFKLFG